MASGQRLSMAQVTQRLDKAFNIGQRWDAVKAFAVSRPKTALFLLAVFITFSIPITSFIIIIGSSLFVGLTMLVWIQGAVLTTATAVLLPTLGFCALVAAGLTMVVHGSHYVMDALRSTRRFVYDIILPYIAATMWGLTIIWSKHEVEELQNED